MKAISDDFKSRNTPPEGALLPAADGEIEKNKDLELKKQPVHTEKSENLAYPW